jgi:twitching motility protein PilT
MQDLTEKQRSRIGEMLLDDDLITQEQLAKALDSQIQRGGRLGSILEDMGYVDNDTLLNVLSKQYNLPFINLFEVKIPPDIMRLVPFELVRTYKVLPLNKSGDTVSLAMISPDNMDVIKNVELASGCAVRPVIVSLYQMDKAISRFEKEGYGDIPFDGEQLREGKVRVENKIPGIYTLLRLIPDFRATDLYLTAGAPPGLRINNEFKRLSMPVITTAQMRDFLYDILKKGQMEEFERDKELDFVLSLKDTGRFRINLYKQRNSVSLSARLIFENIPSVKELCLPEWINDHIMKPQGLILIAGLPGNGKAATISALVDVINSTRKCNIVTLEDPIEYLHKHKKSNVNQREIGIDTESFSTGLKHVTRQGADVIVISELRDTESIVMALNAAETGHMVISAMTSLNTITALDRVINIFPQNQQPQIKVQLADTLLLVLSQKLIPRKEGYGKILACEKLTGSSRVRNLIRDGKTVNIKALMQVASEDMLSIDRSLAKLCFEGRIAFEDGLKFADTPSYYQDLIRTGNV